MNKEKLYKMKALLTQEQYCIMRPLWDNPNTQGIAQLMQSIVLPAIAKMPEDQQIEAMGTVRDAVQDIAEYEECKDHMVDTVVRMRARYNKLVEEYNKLVKCNEENNEEAARIRGC